MWTCLPLYDFIIDSVMTLGTIIKLYWRIHYAVFSWWELFIVNIPRSQLTMITLWITWCSWHRFNCMYIRIMHTNNVHAISKCILLEFWIWQTCIHCLISFINNKRRYYMYVADQLVFWKAKDRSLFLQIYKVSKIKISL